jgi:hypothetical protein
MKFDLCNNIEDLKFYLKQYNAFYYRYVKRGELIGTKFKGDTVVEFSYYGHTNVVTYHESLNLVTLLSSCQENHKLLYMYNIGCRLVQQHYSRSSNLMDIIKILNKNIITESTYKKLVVPVTARCYKMQSKFHKKVNIMTLENKSYYYKEFRPDYNPHLTFLPIFLYTDLLVQEPFEFNDNMDFNYIKYDKLSGSLKSQPGNWVLAKFGFHDIYTNSIFFSEEANSMSLSGLSLMKSLQNDTIYKCLYRKIDFLDFKFMHNMIKIENKLPIPYDYTCIERMELIGFSEEYIEKKNQENFEINFPSLNYQQHLMEIKQKEEEVYKQVHDVSTMQLPAGFQLMGLSDSDSDSDDDFMVPAEDRPIIPLAADFSAAGLEGMKLFLKEDKDFISIKNYENNDDRDESLLFLPAFLRDLNFKGSLMEDFTEYMVKKIYVTESEISKFCFLFYNILIKRYPNLYNKLTDPFLKLLIYKISNAMMNGSLVQEPEYDYFLNLALRIHYEKVHLFYVGTFMLDDPIPDTMYAIINNGEGGDPTKKPCKIEFLCNPSTTSVWLGKIELMLMGEMQGMHLNIDHTFILEMFQSMADNLGQKKMSATAMSLLFSFPNKQFI